MKTSDLQADFKCHQEVLASFTALTCASNLQAGDRHKLKPPLRFLHSLAFVGAHLCGVNHTNMLH